MARPAKGAVLVSQTYMKGKFCAKRGARDTDAARSGGGGRIEEHAELEALGDAAGPVEKCGGGFGRAIFGDGRLEQGEPNIEMFGPDLFQPDMGDHRRALVAA